MVHQAPHTAKKVVAMRKSGAEQAVAAAAAHKKDVAAAAAEKANAAGNEEEEEAKDILSKRFKTKLCTNYVAQGVCPYAERCRFAHGDAELRTCEENIRDGLITEEAVKQFLRQQAAHLKSSRPSPFLQRGIASRAAPNGPKCDSSSTFEPSSMDEARTTTTTTTTTGPAGEAVQPWDEEAKAVDSMLYLEADAAAAPSVFMPSYYYNNPYAADVIAMEDRQFFPALPLNDCYDGFLGLGDAMEYGMYDCYDGQGEDGSLGYRHPPCSAAMLMAHPESYFPSCDMDAPLVPNIIAHRAAVTAAPAPGTGGGRSHAFACGTVPLSTSHGSLSDAMPSSSSYDMSATPYSAGCTAVEVFSPVDAATAMVVEP